MDYRPGAAGLCCRSRRSQTRKAIELVTARSGSTACARRDRASSEPRDERGARRLRCSPFSKLPGSAGTSTVECLKAGGSLRAPRQRQFAPYPIVAEHRLRRSCALKCWNKAVATCGARKTSAQPMPLTCQYLSAVACLAPNSTATSSVVSPQGRGFDFLRRHQPPPQFGN